MKKSLFILLVSVVVISGCTGSTKPDQVVVPAPVEDRSIGGQPSQAHIVNRPSEILPMQHARAEPSPPRSISLEDKPLVTETVVQRAPVSRPKQVSKPIPDVALLETKRGIKPATVQAAAVSSSDSPAVDALLSEANRQLKTGNHDGAAASLERALRVEPRDAYLWHRLAYVRLKQVRGSQAESMALKSISLSGDKTELINSNWRLIARARKLLDDAAGAQDALARIQ